MYIYSSNKTNTSFVNVSKKDLEALSLLLEVIPEFSEQTKNEIKAFCIHNQINYENANLNFEIKF